jgi:uncharacterized protein (DUF2062 family)
MRRWLKRMTPDRVALERHWCLRPFAALIAHREYWTFNRASVSRTFALGLFIAFIPPTPFFPLHIALCAILGLSFRLNLPVLFATVFLSNPFTWLPQIAGSIWVGAKLTGLDLGPFVQELSRRSLWAHLNRLWEPLLLGALVLGLAAAALGYALAQGLWRMRVAYHLQQRRARSVARSCALDQNTFR